MKRESERGGEKCEKGEWKSEKNVGGGGRLVGEGGDSYRLESVQGPGIWIGRDWRGLKIWWTVSESGKL